MSRTRLADDVSEYLSATPATNDLPHRILITNLEGRSLGSLINALRDDFEYPVYTLDMDNPSVTDLLGEPVLKPGTDSVEWTDGTLSKALKASQNERVFLTIHNLLSFLEEPAVKMTIQNALDSEVTVQFPQKNKTISGNRENLVVLAGIDESIDMTEIDQPIRERFTTTFDATIDTADR